ncbi:MAG: acyl-CoA thioesterase [Bacteroidales bacterium]|jgi:acyl-CoA thioester hydrolase|nr:acyl-CoA thioesterase [Bacteroidales bacterium]
MIVSEMNLEVRYYETDLMGIVHHSNYIRYFECGRNQLMKDIGLPITEIEKYGYMLPVVDASLKYRTPARMGDILKIVTKIETLPMAKIYTVSEIRNQEGSLVCNGKVTLGIINSGDRKPVRCPSFFADKMKKYFNQ